MKTEWFGGDKSVTVTYVKRRHLPFHDEARLWMITWGLAVLWMIDSLHAAFPRATLSWWATFWLLAWWLGAYRQRFERDRNT